MIVKDDYGWQWAVQNGDPAAAIIVALARLGYRNIILPRETIVGGVVVNGPSVAALEEQARVYGTTTDLDDGTRKTLADSLLHQMVLYDICTALGRIEGLTPRSVSGTIDRRHV